jgi:hypothetical protein
MKSSQAANSVLPSLPGVWRIGLTVGSVLFPAATKFRVAEVRLVKIVLEAGKPATGWRRRGRVPQAV